MPVWPEQHPAQQRPSGLLNLLSAQRRWRQRQLWRGRQRWRSRTAIACIKSQLACGMLRPGVRWLEGTALCPSGTAARPGGHSPAQARAQGWMRGAHEKLGTHDAQQLASQKGSCRACVPGQLPWKACLRPCWQSHGSDEPCKCTSKPGARALSAQVGRQHAPHNPTRPLAAPSTALSCVSAFIKCRWLSWVRSSSTVTRSPGLYELSSR